MIILLFLVSAVAAGTTEESLRLSIGQPGLDFASDVSGNMLTELSSILSKGGLKLPDIHGDVDITGLKLSGLQLEKPTLSVVPGKGLRPDG